MADWSSLPSELVRRITDCLLDTNDLDCYEDFRAVCPKWRSATDDPKDSSEIRFRPHRWVIIDEVFQSDARLLVNTVSGRVVRKDLPLLANYHVIATTHGGFFVLADKESPHGAVILNPFTGHMIRFKAPVPSYVNVSAAALSGHCAGKLLLSSFFSGPRSSRPQCSSPTLILLWDICYEQYMATPDSGSFNVEFDEEGDPSSFILMRLAVTGGICAADSWKRKLAPLPAASARKIFSLIQQFGIDPHKMFGEKPVSEFTDIPGTGESNHAFLVESAGELLAIIKLQKHLKVFRLDKGDGFDPVKSIGGRAVFVGYRRCISVNTGKIPPIAASCVYYMKSTDSSLDIYKYDIETEIEERVCEAIDSLNPITLSFASPPFTIVQLLSSYTINVGESQLAMEKLKLQDLEMERLRQQDPHGGFPRVSFPEDFSFPDLDLDDDISD
ncbi:hypothetical protein ACQ4PT_005233 [Festuca glaucescens]